MNRIDWLRQRFFSARGKAQDWQLGYEDGLAGHRQRQGEALDVLAYRNGWIEGNSATLQAAMVDRITWQPGGKDRRYSTDRRADDRRTVSRRAQQHD